MRCTKRNGKGKTWREKRKRERERKVARTQARREETEIERGRGRWRLQGYTRPEQSPVRSRERVEGPPKVPTVSARGEAPALSHATPRYALTLYEQH